MESSVLKSLKQHEIQAIIALLCAVLFLSAGVFGLLRGELLFLLFLADGILLGLVSWFVSPWYQFGKIPARGLEPIAGFPAPKSMYHYWKNYRAFDHDLGLPKKKSVVYLPLILTILLAAAIVAAVFLIGNTAFPADPGMMGGADMGMDGGMGGSMGGNMGMTGGSVAIVG